MTQKKQRLNPRWDASLPPPNIFGASQNHAGDLASLILKKLREVDPRDGNPVATMIPWYVIRLVNYSACPPSKNMVKRMEVTL